MKKARVLIAATILSASMSMSAFAGEWKQDSVGWWYQNDDGSYPANSWFQDVDAKWYYFNESGYMQTTPITMQDGITYNFNADGSCMNRWEGAADLIYYDRSEGEERSVGGALADRDYINSIGGGTGSMFGGDNKTSSTHTLTPDTIVDWDDAIYDEEED